MISKYLIKNTTVINEGKSSVSDILFYDNLIQKIGNIAASPDFIIIDGTGKYLFPGVIDGASTFS